MWSIVLSHKLKEPRLSPSIVKKLITVSNKKNCNRVFEIMLGPKGKKEFLDFRTRLYRNDPGYVYTQEYPLKMLLRQTTAFAKACFVQPVCVRLDGQIVCECLLIRAPYENILQIAYPEAESNANIHFIYMLENIEDYASSQGYVSIIAGLCGHLSYGVGILCSGFYKNTFDSIYNKSGYDRLFNSWESHSLTAYRGEVNKLKELVNKNKPSSGSLTVRNINLKRFSEEMEIFRRLCDETIGKTELYKPTEKGHFYELMKDMLFFLRPENILFACDGDHEVGFIFWYPDYNRILPSGKPISDIGLAIRYLIKHNQIDTAKINSIGVLDRYIGRATSLLINETAKYILSDGYRYVETTFVWDSNLPSRALNRYLFCSNGDNGAARLYRVFTKSVHKEQAQ